MNNFDDLLAANRDFAVDFALGGFDGVAHAGLAIVTCMDSRIDPLGMVGLVPGDAKIFRNPGARVTEAALEALVLGVHLLEVDRIMIVPAHPLRRRLALRGRAAPPGVRVGRTGRLVAGLPRHRGPGAGAGRGRAAGAVAPADPRHASRSAASSTTSIPGCSPRRCDRPGVVRSDNVVRSESPCLRGGYERVPTARSLNFIGRPAPHGAGLGRAPTGRGGSGSENHACSGRH